MIIVLAGTTASGKGWSKWYDLDMPPVVELRHQFFTESERCHMIADVFYRLAALFGYQPSLAEIH